jgi:hypothetical protein
MTLSRALIIAAVVLFLLDAFLIIFNAGDTKAHTEILYFGLAAFAGGHVS